MWTVCWVDNEGNDKWDRLERRNDVIILLDALKEELGELEGAVLVFAPNTETDISTLI